MGIFFATQLGCLKTSARQLFYQTENYSFAYTLWCIRMTITFCHDVTQSSNMLAGNSSKSSRTDENLIELVLYEVFA
jgi:hypothetical protein